MLSFLFSFSFSDERTEDPLWKIYKFSGDGDNHGLYNSIGFFNFQEIDNTSIIFTTEKKPLNKHIFSSTNSFVSFHSDSDKPIFYECWTLEQTQCNGLNYWIDMHYGMKISMNNVKHDKMICLFMPSDYSITTSLNTTNDDIKTIYKGGIIKKIVINELNDFGYVSVHPYILVLPPSENRTIELDLRVTQENDTPYCHARPIEDYNKNLDGIYEYEIPFNYHCYEEEEHRLVQVLWASIVAAVSASILFTIHYFPYFCPNMEKKEEEILEANHFRN